VDLRTRRAGIMSVFPWLGRWWSRLIAGLALATVAGVTGRISYLHIKALTLALHQPPQVAQIMPFGVDGLIVVGSVVLLQAVAGQEWLGWLGIGPGVAASLFANAESGIAYGWLSAVWATVPAVAFAVATFMFERWLKGQVAWGTSPRPGTTASPQTEDVSATPGGILPEVPHPLTPDLALRALLDSESDQMIALLMGVSRNKVRAWRDRAETAGTPDDELAGHAMNGSAGG
jgi:hypothetical protein